MPRNSSGLYQQPADTEAIANELIESEKYNTLISDIGDELTASLPRDGRAAMTGALALISGSDSGPALKFTAAPTTGVYYDTGNSALVFVVGGAKIFELKSSRVIGLPIGTPVPVLSNTLPDLCIWADGRNVSRTTYAALFAVFGTTFGDGDGSTTFGMPDLRGRVFVGRDNLGGTDAARLSSAPVTSGSRTTVGGIIGGNTHTLSTDELAAHAHFVTVSGAINDLYPINTTQLFSTAAPQYNLDVCTTVSSTPNGFTASGSSNNTGGGSAHNNVQASFVCDFAIFAGV